MSAPFWIYILIPVLSALVGYGTNVLAVWMTFNPLKFWPVEVWRLDDQPWGLFGWQGIIPTKAGEMTAKLYDAFMERVIDVKEVFSKIDPKEIARLTNAEMQETTRALVHKLGASLLPDTWTALSPHVKADIVSLVLEESAAYVQRLIAALQDEVLEVVDLKGLMVRIVLSDVSILCEMFQTTGGTEFTFIRNSGLYFGFLFGLCQALVYFFYKGKWVLPVAGFGVGYLTNWVALKLIFEPAHPHNLGCYTLQGLFLKRQHVAATVIADNSMRFFLAQEILWEEVLRGRKHLEWQALLRRVTDSFLRERASLDAPRRIAAALVLGEETLQEIVKQTAAHINEELPSILPRTFTYMDGAMDIETTIREALQAMPPDEFIGILRPAFQADEAKLILVGGLLGAAAGALQQFAIFDYL